MLARADLRLLLVYAQSLIVKYVHSGYSMIGNCSSTPISRVCRAWILHIDEATLAAEVPQAVNAMSEYSHQQRFLIHILTPKML